MDFELFMKKNKVENNATTKYAPTKSLVGKDGKPLEWTFKKITSKENELIKEKAIQEVPIEGKKNQYRPKLNTSKYMTDLIIASTVEPDLKNKTLQDSYGVMGEEALLYAMVDDMNEFSKLEQFIQSFLGMTSLDEEVEEAKN